MIVRRSLLVLALAAAILRPAPCAGEPAAADSLVGLWTAGLSFGPDIRGELSLRREGDMWHATIAGHEVVFPVEHDSVRFSLPGGIGGFRGAWSHDRRVMEGYWLQAATGVRDARNPGGEFQPFSSPLVLRSTGHERWSARVRPLEERFSLGLRISRDPGGGLVGAFRNPERNSNGGASRFRVSVEGDSVWFVARPDTSRPAIRLGAARVRSPERLRIRWPDLGRTLDLTRRGPSRSAAFLPRPPADTAYVYRRPPSISDGWRTARARDVGLDEAALTRLVSGLIHTDPFAARPSLIHSLLIARGGRLVLEEYFFGFDRERPHDLRSAGKTFASILLGAAMRSGVGIGPQTRVFDLLADLGPFANPDPRKSRITLAHLMTHTSGLACDDADDASPGNEDVMQGQGAQPDWWKYTLDLPVLHEPGTRYAYCSAGMNLVGAALTHATGTWLPDLFERAIARPLEFGPHYWNLMPTGEGYLGGGAYLRPRDLLKVGQVYLDGGMWHGRRIVDSSWVTGSTARQVAISPASTGMDSVQFRNFYVEGADGYAWHLNPLLSGGRTYSEYQAAGNGGQLLIVVPDLDLAVVLTGGNYRQGGIWGRWASEIVGGRIIPAIRR